MAASSSNAAAAALLTDGLVRDTASETIGGGDGGVASIESPLEGKLGGALFRQREVGRSEALGALRHVVGVARSQELSRQLPSPLPVGCTHRDDEIEPSGAEQSRVDGRDGIRRHDHQAAWSRLEDRDGLEQFVDDGLALRPRVPSRRDLVRLVNEAEQPVDMTQVGQRAAQ